MAATKLTLYRASDRHRAVVSKITSGEKHETGWRSPFRRDYSRLLHSAAFRRLQGKTQLFAGLESDFFRNRLTHSLEVAQIAKTIALKLNHEQFSRYGCQLDTDLVELAALAHDLGHPPFGHTGEAVLDELMRDSGGFEGNAQTLRILSRLEKKLDDLQVQMYEGGPAWYREDADAAVGLNLCSRSLAAILKYDAEIPVERSLENGKLELAKGYYASEAPVVARIRQDVLGSGEVRKLKVIECQIMDLADDIAYSTYDLEDAFKGGLLTPLDLLYPEDRVAEEVARRVARELNISFPPEELGRVVAELFGYFAMPQERPDFDRQQWYFEELGRTYSTAKEYATNGFYRTALTSGLVNEFVHAVRLKVDQRQPALSRVYMQQGQRLMVSVLKQLTYVLMISSSRLRLVSHRGSNVVRSIFEALSAPGGDSLLPEDYRQKYRQAPERLQPRVICDFIACMTDRYAVEFYARLSSETFYSMFKPL